MLNTMTAAPCRITSISELEHEYQRARLVYRMHCAAGDIGGAMAHLSNMMRLYRSIRWAQAQYVKQRSVPPSLGPELSLSPAYGNQVRAAGRRSMVAE